MWFDWKKNAVYQVLSLEHVSSQCRVVCGVVLTLCQMAVSLDASPAGNLVAIGTRDRVVKLIDFQHATLQVKSAPASVSLGFRLYSHALCFRLNSHALKDHVGPLGGQECVSFSPDGSTLACASGTEASSPVTFIVQSAQY